LRDYTCQARNPLFNKNRLKLGTFATNTVAPYIRLRPMPTVPRGKLFARGEAWRTAQFRGVAPWHAGRGWRMREYNIEAGVVLIHLCGAGISMDDIFRRLATSHAPTVHPLMSRSNLQRSITCRAALRLTSLEVEQTRVRYVRPAVAEHDARYDYLDEWVSVLQRLCRRRKSSTSKASS